jgi:spoIIIJ-associated protein
MEWVETTGRTVEEALDAALDELGVNEADAEWEVLEQPRRGLLGRLGGAEARIRARVKPVSREKPGDRRRRGGSRPRTKAPARQADGSGRAAERSPARSDGEPSPGAATRSPRRRRGRGSGSGPGRVENDITGGEGASVNEIPIEEQAQAAEEFTAGVVDAFATGATVLTRIEGDDTVLVEVEGTNLGLLVGPRGATLQAIEELVRTVVQRQTGGHGVRIHVDVGGYRAKRRAALSEFARGLAQQVLDSGTDLALEPMPPADRKVVHDTVAELEGVTTESAGEEPRRRVVIRPS